MVSVVAIYGISLPTGYIIIRSVLGLRLSAAPLVVRLLIYIAFGVTVLIPVYLALSFVKVTALTLITIFLLSLISILLGRRTWRGRVQRTEQKGGIASKGLVDEILPLTIFVVTALYFLLMVDYMKWPPAGDIISGNGPLVSLIEFAGKLPIEPSPIILLYPPGFHVITATFNSMLKLYPAEAVFLVGSSIIILVPQLLYGLTYVATRSKTFSTVAFFATFLIHPSGHLDKWIVGYFFNGTYPSLMGFLIILTFMNLLALIDTDCSKKDWFKARQSLLTSLLVSVTLVFTYPPFALLTITYIIVIVAINRGLFWQHLRQASRDFDLTSKVFLGLAISITLALAYALFLHFYYIFDVIISYIKGSYFPGGIGVGGAETRLAYYLSPSIFFDNVNGMLIPIAYAVGAYSTIRLRNFGVPLFFLLTSTLVFASLNEMIYRFVLYIMPTRSVIILFLLSWPLILTMADKIITKMFMPTRMVALIFKQKKVTTSFAALVKGVLAILTICAFITPLSAYFSFQQLETWSWFSHQPWFKDDLAALEWINKNVGPTDLIFNDASHASNYLWSLSIKNLTGHPWSQFVYEERFNALMKVWQDPRDIEYIKEVFKKYDVRYVFSTSEWGYQLYGKRHGYFAKPYSPEQYAEIFDHYPFLETVFKAGSTRVYKVNLPEDCQLVTSQQPS